MPGFDIKSAKFFSILLPQEENKLITINPKEMCLPPIFLTHITLSNSSTAMDQQKTQVFT